MAFLTPQAHGERDVWLTFALQQLAQVRAALHGLTDDQAHASPTASSLNLSGLALHTASVAVHWSTCAAAAQPEEQNPQPPHGFERNPSLDELVSDRRPLAELLEDFDRAVSYTESTARGLVDLSAPVPVPDSPWIPEEVRAWEVRWCLAHLCTENARHAGHADLLRETLDGKDSLELNDLADAAE